jgi:hypothetical protein
MNQTGPASHPVSSTSLGASAQQEEQEDAQTAEVTSQAAPLPPHEAPQQPATATAPGPPAALLQNVARALRLPPSSSTSSRASSPRSALSAQPSLQTLHMSRLANYRGKWWLLVVLRCMPPTTLSTPEEGKMHFCLQLGPVLSSLTPSRVRDSPPGTWWRSAPRQASSAQLCMISYHSSSGVK